MSSEAAFSDGALRYLLRHAVEPALAAELGVGELDGALTFRYMDADGEYRRRRPLDGSRTFQPPGRSLALWWPAGRPAAGADVLLCEGEPDALAALSALAVLNGRAPIKRPVVGAIPGTGTPVATIVDELRSAGAVTLAMDGDKAGRECALRLDPALRAAGLTVARIEPPLGKDLADLLVGSEDPGQTLAGLLADAPFSEAAADPAPPSTTWAPLPLADVIAGGAINEPPSILRRTDGPALIYPDGRIHSIHAEPEALKTFLALLAVQELTLLGRPVVFIDFEDSASSVVGRLLNMGVPADVIAAQLLYIRPDEPLSTAALADLDAAMERHPALAIVDGVTEAYNAQGLNPLDNVDIATWLDLLPRRITRAGIPVILLDHVVKDREQRGRYAIGGQHKLAGVDVAYSMRVIEPFARGREGRVSIKVEKDRPGRVREFAVDHQVALLRATSGPGGAVALTLEPPDGTAPVFRPTTLMERVSRAVEAEGGLSKRSIRTAVAGKSATVDLALDVLINEGYIEPRPDGRATRHYSTREFRAADLNVTP